MRLSIYPIWNEEWSKSKILCKNKHISSPKTGFLYVLEFQSLYSIAWGIPFENKNNLTKIPQVK